MQEGLPLYNGALPVAAQQKLVGVPQLPQGQLMGAAFDAAVDDGLRMVDTYTRLHDFAEEQRVEHQLRLNDRKMQEELFQAQNARWGSKGSFFNADGSVNEDNVAAFCSRWRDANDGIERTFLRRDNAISDAGRMSRQNDDLTTRIELSTMRQALANGKKAFEANYAEAMANGDHEGAARALAGAVNAGWLHPAEAELKKLRLQQGSARAKVARMTAEEQIDALLEGKPSAKASRGIVALAKPAAAPEAAAKETPAAAPAAATETPAETTAEPPAAAPTAHETSAASDLTLDAEMQKNLDERSAELTLDERFVRDVTEAKPSVLGVEEQQTLLHIAMAQDKAVKIDAQTGASSISGAAPEAAQMAVSEANRAGGWTRERYRDAVYALGNELVSSETYKHLSDAEMEKVIRKMVTVEGMEEQLFAGEMDPKAAYDSYVNGMVGNIMSGRNGEVQKRVQAALAGGRGTEEIKLPDEDAAPGLVEYAVMRASEELGRYRQNGGEADWYTEQDIISKAIQDAKKEYFEKGYEEAWKKFRADKAAVALADTKKREEDLGIARADLKAAQEAAAKKKAAKEAAKEAAEKAAKKKPTAPKKKTKAELLKERPYLGEVEVRFNYVPNDSKDATITMPKEAYEAMCSQFELAEDEVLYCSFGGRKVLRVVPGEGKACSVNRAAVSVLTGGMSKKRMTEAVKDLKRGTSSVVKFKKVKG